MRKWGFAVVVLALLGCGDNGSGAPLRRFGDVADRLLAGPCGLTKITVRDHGQVVYSGAVDLLGEVERISRGEHLPFKHDGTVFENREQRLPMHDQGYYHEYVHPTPGVQGPGPQRLVIGAAHELEYTENHYLSFHLLPEACWMAAEQATAPAP